MKTLLSIPLILLMTFSGFSLKYSAHFCQGEQVASEISLSGRNATCGMEDPPEGNSQEDILRNHCCDNVTASYSTSWNYISTVTYSTDRDIHQAIDLILPYGYSGIEGFGGQNRAFTRPPGRLYPDNISLPSICVFRI